MDKLVCSICGYVGNQKRFRNTEINEHFDNAKEVWCPTNKCIEENKDKRIIPKGYVKNWWYEYGGWCTVEEEPKIIDIETVKSIQKAKHILDIGLQILKEHE